MPADMKKVAKSHQPRRIAYFDCFSGVSGDMILGALIDLGVPAKWLEETLNQQLMLSDFQLNIQRVMRRSIQAQSVTVVTKDSRADRNYASIRKLIEGSHLSNGVKKRSLSVFDCLAEAESKIHGCPKDSVHFHEVGGVDAIVDVVGAIIGIDYLGIQQIVASKIATGRGYVMSQHGKLPIPAPATLSILKDRPLYGVDIEHELVTPTGAAILVTLAQSFDIMPTLTIKGVGYGAGARDLAMHPNVLRIVLGTAEKVAMQGVVVVETCIDDMNPEIFGYLMERLFDDGALDVYWIPVFMKKNRPGTKIQVLCTDEHKDQIVHRILTETTSIGIRFYPVQRHVLDREQITIESRYGTIAIKKVTLPDGLQRWVPEYEDCRRIAAERNIPIRQVYEAIAKEVEASSALPDTGSH